MKCPWPSLAQDNPRMKYTADRPFADPEAAAREYLEIGQ